MLEIFLIFLAIFPFWFVSVAIIMWVFKRCYIAGTSFKELGKVNQKLKKRGIGSTIDILGEHIKNLKEAKDCLREYFLLISWIDSQKNFSGKESSGLKKSISVKLTHLGLNLNYDVCFYYLHELVEEAKSKNIFVWVDAEEKETLDSAMSAVFGIHRCPHLTGWVGMVIQSCHSESASRVAACCADKIPVRLCKGAYPDGDITDEKKLRNVFTEQIKKFFGSGTYVGIATHDSAAIEAVEKYILLNSVPTEAFEFQMLLGIRMKLQEKLAEKYRIVTYLPFGKNYKAYLKRRFKKGFRNFGLAWMFIRNIGEGFVFSLKK